jgi:hypothetical protein
LANAPGVDFAAGLSAAIAVTPPAPPPAYTILQPGYVSAANPPHPADLIANNPAVYNVAGAGGVNVYNTTSASQLMTAAVSGNGSFSYDIVAGASFQASGAPAVDPNAVVRLSSPVSPVNPSASITVDGHTTYTDTLGRRGSVPVTTINIPTLVRTGTGSITMTAAGNVEFLDQLTPGAVYTAGAAITTPANFNAPTLPFVYTNSPNGLACRPGRPAAAR